MGDPSEAVWNQPAEDPTDADQSKKWVARSATEVQRKKLEKLMAKPVRTRSGQGEANNRLRIRATYASSGGATW